MAWDGTSWVGFGLDSLDPDPASPPAYAPYSGAATFGHPCTWTYREGETIPEVITSWAHADASGFGGTRALRMWLDSPASQQCAVGFPCGNGSTASWDLRWQINAANFTGEANFYLEFHGPFESSFHGYIFIDETGAAALIDSAAATIDTGATAIVTGGEYELKLTIQCTNGGTVTLEVNGTTVLSGSGNFDGGGLGEGLGGVYLYMDSATAAYSAEVYVGAFMAFPAGVLPDADIYIVMDRPTGDHAIDSTPSTGAVAAAVIDEAPFSTADSTSFATIGDIDLYTWPELAADVGTIHGVSLVGRAVATSSWEVEMLGKRGVNTTSSAPITLQADFRTFGGGILLAPDALAWTRAKANLTHFGLEVTASGAGDLDLAALGREVLCERGITTAPSGSYALTGPSPRTYAGGLC